MANISPEYLSRLEELANEICTRESCRLYDLELVGDARGRILRVWIEKSPADGAEGVSIEDCANVSNGLSLRLDVEDIIPGGAYHLEVSSPGLDRRLKKPWHYQTAIGKKVRLRLHSPMAEILASSFAGEMPAHWVKMRQLEEKLVTADEVSAEFVLDQHTVRVPMSEIDKASVVVEFAVSEESLRKQAAKKPGKKAKK